MKYQVCYNNMNRIHIPKSNILKDWICFAKSLTRSFDEGADSYFFNENTNFRNEPLAKMIEKCLDFANTNCSKDKDVYYELRRNNKRRQLSSLSILFHKLRSKYDEEMEKQLPPPPSIFMSS